MEVLDSAAEILAECEDSTISDMLNDGTLQDDLEDNELKELNQQPEEEVGENNDRKRSRSNSRPAFVSCLGVCLSSTSWALDVSWKWCQLAASVLFHACCVLLNI